MNSITKSLAKSLFEIGAVKFGAFKIKIHKTNPDAPLCPYYFDLRVIRSFPKVMKETIEVYKNMAKDLDYDLIADIPLGSSPFASNLAWVLEKPMITPRPEVKNYGTKKVVEGEFKGGQKVLVVDDLITAGDSKIEVLNIFKEADLKVSDVLVLIDREQGGAEKLDKMNYKLHSAMTTTKILDFYLTENMITKEKHQEILNYMKENQ